MQELAYKSKVKHSIGTILIDDETQEKYEVVSCERIGILDEYNFGIKVIELKTVQQ
jgi:hypothetical protein